ncbi:hypothetical protein ELQ92_03665 [Labedella populi]|uniref:Uncharacterized protein n=1 Tax=Labedella populi TaxID=2498850 RepID=A0A444QFN1_9MICO|nr:hypothetical protein [Labedella populi]RWZ68328.1 hypothetical protein ELQ92_03665 [Labedella populi]
MDSTASSFRRDRRGARGPGGERPAESGGTPPARAAADGDTIGWDPEREVVVSASAIPPAAEATWAPSPDQPSPLAAAPAAGARGLARPTDPAGADGGAVRLGWEPGQPSLSAGTPRAAAPVKRGLVSGATVLPEITEAPPAPRKLWKHPAFILSMVTTVIAVGAAVTLIIMAALAEGPPRVTGLDITAGSGGVALSWNGPDVPYDVFVVGDGGDVLDVSQGVRGRGIWLPRAFDTFDDDSCFVVRAESIGGDVALGAEMLDEQGAASVCVADADE